MANEKDKYLLLKEMEFDVTSIANKIKDTEDLRELGNLYRDMGELMDVYAEKIEEIDG